MKWKNIRLKLTAAAMTAAMGLQMAVQPMQAAAASTQYLSEVIISYGTTDAEAKNWLTQNGYKVVNQNLNEGGEGGSDAFSWLGLASERRSVYLGYKTTTDPSEAITDMKLMNMNGGYSYEAYEKVLQELAKEKEHFLENIMAALKEYRENYKKGAVKAKIAHDNLNKFKDDDSGQLMGDLLLNTLRTEDEAAWEADPTKHADMVTILMQGNSTCVSEIMQNLAFAADTADDSFVSRAIAAANSDQTKNAFDTFFEDFMKKHPDYTKDEAVSELMQLYDDDAKMFASSLIGLQNYLSNYTMSELPMTATLEEADQYFAEHEYESESTWAGAANLYSLLAGVEYGNSTLASYLVYSEDDYLDNTALLSGYDALGLPQRAALYPLIAQMSQGQRCLLEYTAMDRMLTTGLMDADTWASTYATMQDAAFGVTDYEPCSVFAEVNRNDFQVGEIAVTNAAQGKAASLGEEVSEGLFGVGVSYLTGGLFVGGIAATIAGVAIAAKNWSTASSDLIRESVVRHESLASLGNEAGAVINKITGYGTTLVQPLHEMHRALDTVMRGITIFSGSGDAKTLLDMYKQYSADAIQTFITKAGPDSEIRIGNFLPKVDEKNMKVTFSNGKVWDIETNQVVYHSELDIQNQIRYVKPNPELINAATKADEALKAFLDAVPDNLSEVNLNDMYKKLYQPSFAEHFEEYVQLKNVVLNNADDMTKEQFDDFVKFMQEKYPDGEMTSIVKDVQKYNVREYMVLKKQANSAHELLTETNETAVKKSDDAAEAAMTSGSGSTFWKWFGVGMAIVGLAMSIYSAYAAITEMQAYYHQEMLPIPRKMVDLGYYDDGSHCYIYYDCAKCNRTEMNMGNETLGDYGDLNGDVMKQWIALYTTKDTRAGSPIQAGFTVKKGTTNIPVRTVPLSFFGFDYAVNMTDTRFAYNNNLNGIYLYYKQLASKYTGTVETDKALVTTGVLSAIGGAGICGLIVALASKRKKKEPTGEPTAA